MLPPLPNPFTAGTILGLKATVVLLLILLTKSQLLRVKMSFLGSVIGLFLLLNFLAATGVLTLISGGSLLYAFSKRGPGRVSA
ncbi:MAG: hypothetical protein R6U00_04645 [Prochlorococcaceae cyanobacterium]|jgi:hypothetical protein